MTCYWDICLLTVVTSWSDAFLSCVSGGQVFNVVNLGQILMIAVIASAIWWRSDNVGDIAGAMFFVSIQQSVIGINVSQSVLVVLTTAFPFFFQWICGCFEHASIFSVFGVVCCLEHLDGYLFAQAPIFSFVF